MEPITVHFTPTADDHVRVFRYLIFRRYRLWHVLIILLVAVLLCMYPLMPVVTLFISGQSGTVDISLVKFVPLLGYILILAILFIWPPFLIKQRAKRQERFLLETTFEFGEDTIVGKDEHTELKQDWGAFQGADETKEYYVLISAANKNAGRFIPRRAFESPEQEAAFRELLARKLNFKG